jgi:hypothetical protein
MNCMVCYTLQSVLCGKCWEPFCDVLYDANTNLEHHNTVYVIHFKNAVFLVVTVIVHVCNSRDGT